MAFDRPTLWRRVLLLLGTPPPAPRTWPTTAPVVSRSQGVALPDPVTPEVLPQPAPDAVSGTGELPGEVGAQVRERRANQRLTVGMELRAYRDILRRRRFLIVAAMLIAAGVAGIASSLKTPTYTASAEVLLRPGDPAEELYADRRAARAPIDADRYVAAQVDIVESKAVAQVAASEVKGRPEELLDQVSATPPGTKDIIVISARDPDPERAAAVANAFARAYMENRRKAAVAGLERASEQIEARLRELAAVMSTPEASTPGAALSPAAQAIAAQYQTLYSRQQELLVEKSLKRGEAELISEADVPSSPSSPKPVRNAALGALVGLLAGLGYAFLREQLDDRLHSRSQVEDAAQLPVLAELPRDAEAAGQPTEVASHARRASALAEAARRLRTALTFLAVDAPLRRIAVTSSGISEGKSFVAANLAAVYAQAGLRTILVSADLRRPRLDSLFPEVGDGSGLSEIIAGLAGDGVFSDGHGPLRAAALGARRTRIDGLSFLPAGKLPPNPAELLGSKRAAEVFEALADVADVVIVDTPPVLVTDAAVVASSMDGVLLVAVPGQTTRDALALAASTLSASRARLLGVVLNKVRGRDAAYYGLDERGGAPTADEPRRRRRRRADNKKSERAPVGAR